MHVAPCVPLRSGITCPSCSLPIGRQASTWMLNGAAPPLGAGTLRIMVILTYMIHCLRKRSYGQDARYLLAGATEKRTSMLPRDRHVQSESHRAACTVGVGDQGQPHCTSFLPRRLHEHQSGWNRQMESDARASGASSSPLCSDEAVRLGP